MNIVKTMESVAGDTIVDNLKAAIAEAKRLSFAERLAIALLGARKIVQFEMNGILVQVAADSQVYDLDVPVERALRELGVAGRKLRISYQPVIGPYAK